jgi:glycosyltransferase involved in cell wall biosynthesis
MHVGIDASRLSVAARTGTERYSLEVVGALSQIDRLTPYTLYCNGLPASLPPVGTNVRLRNLPFPRLWTHARLSWEMHHHPPDVLFVPAHVVPLRFPPRCVVTVHDLGYLHFPHAHTALRRIELHLSTMWSARVATHIIAVSQATRDDLVAHYGIAPQKITVVHHGVAPHFRPILDATARAAVRERYGMTGRYLLYVGTLQPRKNLVRLIEAFAQAVQDGGMDDVTLVIAGKRGWLTAAIEQRAAEQAVAGRVHLSGYVDDGDLPALLSGALAFVFPSLYEGFGMPVLEAMACGTPVLTSTTTSLPEVAGQAALLVPPHDTAALAAALVRLASDTALRESLRERGQERAALFSWKRCAEQTRAVLLGKNGAT